MTHLSLFSGIGGIDLAAEWAGFTTVAFCEMDDYCCKVLNKHWPDVPICRDVKDMGKEWLDERGIGAVGLLGGGFPCQPYSFAGYRRGGEDDRHLWPEMFRVIREIRPIWVVGENVAGAISMVLDEALSDLEGIGYEAQAYVLPACAVGAKHERRRMFIVAHTSSLGRERRRENEAQERSAGVDSGQLKGLHPFSPWAPLPAPEYIGVAARVSPGLDESRLRALGNSTMPQQIYPILAAIAEIERGA